MMDGDGVRAWKPWLLLKGDAVTEFPTFRKNAVPSSRSE